MKSIDVNTIVGFGDTPNKALEEARKKGIQNPFLLVTWTDWSAFEREGEEITFFKASL